MQRRILLTAALPYANGDIHIGHLVEYIQADVWARFQKLRGCECWFVCADDSHGTPIMLRAEAEGVPPEQLIERMQTAHRRDFAAFHVAFDNYHSTHSPENRALSESFFIALQEKGCIIEKDIHQLYDTEKGMFLPDRYVRGECPCCQSADQYGDSCEVCGNVHSPADLNNPVSALSGTAPLSRPSRHYFLRLRDEEQVLKDWLNAEIPAADGGKPVPRLQREAVNKLQEWLQGGLRDWDISRDPPYFGFRIPNIPEEKYLYVWLDAPIGYAASFKNFCDSEVGRRHGISFEDFWGADNDDGDGAATELYHFIGKDILYFHGLFWPTMLKNAGYRRPTRLFVHGFLTVNGEKMSKSRGTFITAAHYLDCGLNPEALRYYYACKLGDKIEDIDLNLTDFAVRVNTDLVGKLVNIPSRVAGFIGRFFDNCLDETDTAGVTAKTAAALATAYENRRYHEVVRLIMRQADAINADLDAAKPWLLAKDESQRRQLHRVCSDALRRFDLLVGYLSPITPILAAKVVEFLAREAYVWDTEEGIAPLPAAHRINRFTHLMKRLEESTMEKLITPEAATAATPMTAADDGVVTIEAFAKMDIRVAVVKEADEVEGADKLLRLRLDVGDRRLRQVFAGIKGYYAAADLPGRRVVFLANLKPRKMRFGLSEGMVLAAESGGGVRLLRPDEDAPAGAKVR